MNSAQDSPVSLEKNVQDAVMAVFCTANIGAEMKKEKYFKIIFSMLAITIMCTVFGITVQAKKNVTVTPASLDKKAKVHHTVYDKSVAHSMALDEIIESVRKTGGGKLTLKKGAYNFQYSVCIPDNVTVVLKDGVVINNIYDTKAHIAPTTALWQFNHI